MTALSGVSPLLRYVFQETQEILSTSPGFTKYKPAVSRQNTTGFTRSFHRSSGGCSETIESSLQQTPTSERESSIHVLPAFDSGIDPGFIRIPLGLIGGFARGSTGPFPGAVGLF